MSIEVNNHPSGVFVVALPDRLDALSSPEVRERLEQLLERSPARAVLDLRAVTFLDSAGLAVLVSALKRARQEGGDVALVEPEASGPKRVLQLTKFDRVFAISDTPEAAIAGLQTSSSS